MPAELRVFADPNDLGDALADEILAAYAKSDPDVFLLGCPGGRSLRSTYRALAKRRADLRRLVVVMVDEYVENGAAPPVEAHHSCRGFALREIAAPLGLEDEQIWIPGPQDPGAFEHRLSAAGGIDVFLLASGTSDGHVAFLPPGSPRDGRTSVVELAASTRRDNLVTYPEFGSIDDVPTHGVSVGLATIADSRAVRLVLHGPDKQTATARVLALEGFDPSWPASIVHECADGEILVDRAAMGEAS